MKEYKQTVIDGEIAIKPYYYIRNGLLHARYTVDRAVELSVTEEEKIKAELMEKPYDKQSVLADNWNFLTKTVEKPIIHDGIREVENRIKENNKKYGLKN